MAPDDEFIVRARSVQDPFARPAPRRYGVAARSLAPSPTAQDHTLWWPPTKVAAPHLAPYLEQVDRGEGAEQPPHGSAAAPILAERDPAGRIELLLGRR